MSVLNKMADGGLVLVRDLRKLRVAGELGGASPDQIENALAGSTRLVADSANKGNRVYFVTPSASNAAQVLNEAVQCCIAEGVRELVVGSGVYTLEEQWRIPSELKITAHGNVEMHRGGVFQGAMLKVLRPGQVGGNALPETIENSAQGHLRGIQFYGRGLAEDGAVEFGDGTQEPRNTGCGFTVEKCSFTRLGCALRYYNNIWCVRHAECFFYMNEVDCLFSSGYNSGENMAFDRCIFANTKQVAINLSAGQALGLTFHQCSFDYQEGGMFEFHADSQTVHCVDCHFEWSSSNPQIRNITGRDNSIRISGGRVVNAAPGGTYATALINLWSAPQFVEIDGQVRSIVVHRPTDSFAGKKVVSIPAGQDTVLVGPLVYTDARCIPKITALSDCGHWYVVPAFDGSAATSFFLQIRTSTPVVEAATFLVTA